MLPLECIPVLPTNRWDGSKFTIRNCNDWVAHGPRHAQHKYLHCLFLKLNIQPVPKPANHLVVSLQVQLLRHTPERNTLERGWVWPYIGTFIYPICDQLKQNTHSHSCLRNKYKSSLDFYVDRLLKLSYLCTMYFNLFVSYIFIRSRR